MFKASKKKKSQKKKRQKGVDRRKAKRQQSPGGKLKKVFLGGERILVYSED